MANFRRIALSSEQNQVATEQAMEFRVFSHEKEFMLAYDLESYSPRVDFRRYFLIVAHQGPCPTGGYRITIERVEGKRGQVVVKVRLEEPGPGEVVTLVGTHPQDAVLVPKHLGGDRDGRVVFSFIDQRGNCLARMSVSIH